MAKRPEIDEKGLSNLFSKTEKAEKSKRRKRGVGRPKVLDTVSPVGVTLDADSLSKLDQMAEEIGTSRHKLLIYAIKDYIRRWDEEGERPRIRQVTTEELDI